LSFNEAPRDALELGVHPKRLPASELLDERIELRAIADVLAHRG
jgi:hypothetical protein